MEMGYEICHYCFGAGRLENEGDAKCPYCDGTGWIEIFDEEDWEDECQ